MKFNKNDRVWIMPDDTSIFEFTARIHSYDEINKLYTVIDNEDNAYNFYEHEMEIETEDSGSIGKKH